VATSAIISFQELITNPRDFAIASQRLVVMKGVITIHFDGPVILEPAKSMRLSAAAKGESGLGA